MTGDETISDNCSFNLVKNIILVGIRLLLGQRCSTICSFIANIYLLSLYQVKVNISDQVFIR